MANPVTYNNNTNPTGALKSGTVSMSVASSLNITGYNWRNGFENNNIWVIYSDTYSQGLSTQGNSLPTIWATPIFTEQGLIDLINVLPARAGQSKFTTLSSAISWLYGEGKYFLSNQNYPYMVVDGLVFFTDAGFSASYPNVGTTLYDLGVQQFTNTMQNGLVWTNNNTKSYFDFDGGDDQIFINNYNNFNNITWSNGITVQVLYKIDDLNDFNGQFRALMGTDGSPRSFNYYLYGPNNPATTLVYHFSANFNSGLSSAVTVQPGRYYLGTFSCGTSSGTYYHNLEVVNSQTGSAPQFYTGVAQYLGRADNFWKGNIGSWKIYNKALSADEITQNYYQGPIVTNGLVFFVDASNLVSYPNNGTTWYNLVSNSYHATLVNGPTYSTDGNGSIVFDGTNDYVTFSNPLNQSNLSQVWTVQAWIKIQSKPRQILVSGLNAGLYIEFFQGDNSLLYLNGGVNDYYTYGGQFTNQGWVLATFRFDNSNGNRQIWRDLSNISTGGPNNTFTPEGQGGTFTIGSGDSDTILGKVACVMMYNRYLSDQEIQQNYGAYRNRFENYFTYANGGTISTVTENGQTFRVHTFTTSGTLTVIESGYAEVLIVGGGGGGSGNYYDDGAGGGAGGLIYKNAFELTQGNMTVTVGAGGSASGGGVGGDGGNSQIGVLTAIGGGGGATHRSAGLSGGSGGGSGGQYSGTDNAVGGTGTVGQGNNGGTANGYSGSGGGGAGQIGFPAVWGYGGNGGNGLPFAINGTNNYYSGGGAGYGYSTSSNAIGGAGGGGNGGNPSPLTPIAGSPNTGGGGGGGRTAGQTPFVGTVNGGSGIVIIRYPIV